MKSLVIFGAGNIGRGFIAPLFSNAGYRVQFIDLDQQRIDALNTRCSYNVFEVFDQNRVTVQVSPVTGIAAQDSETVSAAIADADMLACAVGLNALRFIAPAIAAGLTLRWRSQTTPLDVLVCENGIEAADILQTEVLIHLDEKNRNHAQSSFGCVRTSIGRMIPPNTNSESLDIAVEPYAYLPCDGDAFCAPAPQVPGLDAAAHFDLHIHKKLYLHNCTHACLAYLGAQKKHQTIPDCAADKELSEHVHNCGREIIQALVAEHGESCRQSCEQMLDDLLHRYTNSALADTVLRVCRDPMRKLAAGDRLLGAAALCFNHGISAPYVYRCIHAACLYEIQDEEYANEWQAWQVAGVAEVLQRASGLDENDALVHDILNIFKEYT